MPKKRKSSNPNGSIDKVRDEKRRRLNGADSEAPSTSNDTSREVGQLSRAQRRGRIRRKTSGIRKRICELIERALADHSSPVLSLFTSFDECGTPRALLSDVLDFIQKTQKLANLHRLSRFQLKSISNITSEFRIEEDEPGGELFLKRWPSSDDYNLRTVYVDNLPAGCTMGKLQRLANIYGNVVQVRLGLQPPRWISANKYGKMNKKKSEEPIAQQAENEQKVFHAQRRGDLINVGSQPRSFGFVQFTDVDAAHRMIERFKLNDPRRNVVEVEQDSESVLQRRHPFSEMILFKYLRSIRLLRLRRRRRSTLQFVRLSRIRNKLQVFIRKEAHCRKQDAIANGTYTPKRIRNRTQSMGLPKRKAASSSVQFEVNTVACSSVSTSEISLTTVSTESAQITLTSSISTVDAQEFTEKRHRRRSRGGKKKAKKSRNPRKKMSRRSIFHIRGGRVHHYFERTQVLSLKDYESLREEYLKLQGEAETSSNLPDDQISQLQPNSPSLG
ncbi:unnamed protein product [Caenorhabditis auriculariae]|uniref:RRM domain-containing protein n=1 Tax=Caenorhabditis auriculariae TaxID=2777116 RepID=A0A8S1HJA6_9PELO|nr:unnamed protein product [Caenorhabditis auriculariae]